MALPTARPDIYPLDLVSFGPGVCDCGLVVTPTTLDNAHHAFKIHRHDNSVVTKKAADITLIDRGYLYATQVVASASDVGGQLGVVTRVTTLLDLVKVDERGQVVEVVSGVSPSGVRPVRQLGLGDFVVSGPCLGQVVEVSVDVTVSFDDGAVCRVTDAEYRKLQPVGTRRQAYYRPQMNCRFHPGQRVTCKKRVAIFKDARWLRGCWNANRLVGTVVKVDMSAVLVYWICTTDHRLVEASIPPPAYQNPHDLTLFCAASVYCGWGPADRCFFTQHLEEEEKRDGKEMLDDHCQAPIRTNNTKKRGRRWAQRRVVGRQLDKVDLPMIVAKTRTSVDVLWQDGTREHEKPTESLVPFTTMNEQEFFPEQHVVDNAPLDGATATITNDPDDSKGTSPMRRVGVVRSVCCEDRTVNVSWFKAIACPDEAREVECNATVSTYDLKTDQSVFEGHIVVRPPPPGSIDGGSTPVDQPTQSKKKKKNVDAPVANLSWMGHVVDRPDGHVQVKWGDGSMSTVLPHEIAIVYETDYKVLQHAMGDWVEDNDIDPPKEPVPTNTDNDPQNPDEADSVQANEDGLAVTITGRLTSAVRSLLRLAGEALARGKGFLTDWPPSSLPSSKFPAATENVVAPANLSGGDEELPSDATTMVAEAKKDADVDCEEFAWEGKKTAESARGDDSFLFPNFDVLQSPPDHHYLDTAHQNERQSGSTREKSWAKTVQKEWKILKNDLPETIYVQACDDRMDLLRAVILGANGTPYQDGLFFFDLQLPPSYPAIPPQVYYHSFGLRLNPNLYESGTVCLSLLNTFDGEGTEVWSPTRSSLLQVLVSIQGLVLNDQPYYNEAGYETLLGTPVGRRNALPYGENAYLLSLQTMLQLLRRPPQGFEEFVKDHFRRRGRFVLMSCEGYLQGCPDGTLMGEANTTNAARGQPCSAGLKLALANMTSRLVAAFAEIGAEGCEEFQKLRVPLPCALSTNRQQLDKMSM